MTRKLTPEEIRRIRFSRTQRTARVGIGGTPKTRNAPRPITKVKLSFLEDSHEDRNTHDEDRARRR